ncbi:MAG: TRAP transporter small permease [Synergistaceae bacterium]|jgi:TRAP-type C4-dicarboxylate transport system permease small subunit|nr:TRAP transporter small permease [Synergistaceae bacterium]
MMKVLRFIDDKFEEVFLVSTLFFSVTLLFIQVVLRNLFGNSIYWSEELARYLFIWQAWIAASFATKHSKHINLDIVVGLCPRVVQEILFWIAHILWLSFALYMARNSAELTNLIFSRKTISAAMQIRMGWVYLAVPFGCTLMSFRLVQVMASKLLSSKRRAV